MKQIKKLFFIYGGSLLMMSCSGVALNKVNTTMYETRQQSINKNAIPYNPVVVDLNVDINKKISGSSIRQVSVYSEAEVENTKQFISEYNTAFTLNEPDASVWKGWFK